MSDLKLVNTAATESVPSGTVMRTTFAKSFWYVGDQKFANAMTDIYESLAGSANRGYPISPNPAIADGRPSVVDVRLTTPMTTADFSSWMNTLSGAWTSLQQIEKLTPDKAATAADDQGAVERQATTTDVATKTDSDSLPSKIGGIFTTLEHAGIAVIIALVIGFFLIFSGEIKSGVKRVRFHPGD